MSEIEFFYPDWIHAVWGVGALAILLVWIEVRRTRNGARFVSDSMQISLARTSSLAARIFSHLFLILAMSCFVLALMRPQLGYVEKKVPHLGAQVMVCLDVSKSMLAEDATPNRLERAKSELEVLLNYLKDDQVGLVAFAGSANVLCPLTTDFGYLKMLLREVTTTSVGRGGTLLENPIRKALSGFSDTNDMSKVVILLTDGEDNGSKPLDAARLAAERGIKIITIGMGLETGTRIEMTDPQTGLKSYVRDSSGRDVVSKLDSDMLKKIASATGGAFVPARVGSLDVESIHRDLIQPLTRANGETSHTIKNEVYQWPLVAGLLMMTLSILASNPLAFSNKSFGEWLLSHSKAHLIPFVVLVSLGSNAMAQQTKQPFAPANGQSQKSLEPSENGLGGEFSSRGGQEIIPDDPIECYNLSVDLLQTNTSFAEELLEEARKKAGDNANLRFCSAFNLGWVNVNQANEHLEENPEEALKQLQAAADWFRESIRLRPRYLEARENLEIVLRRIAELNDSLNQADPLSFEKQLDQFIERQSTLVDSNRELLQRTLQIKASGARSQLEFDADLQRTYRLASVDQRLVHSDLSESIRRGSQLVEQFKKEQKGNPSSEADPQKQLRMSQLAAALVYADRAAQKLGQARSQLRLKRADRASLRASSGLDELKRARDQLRDPAEILRQIIADSQLLYQQTRALAQGKNSLAAFLGTQIELPAWLNVEYLSQFQATQLERTDELYQVLDRLSLSYPAKDTQEEPRNAQETLRAQTIEGATDSLKWALSNFRRSAAKLNDGKARQAMPEQSQAIENLKNAYEMFADLKGLLELAYGEQVQLNQDFGAARNLSGDVLQTILNQLDGRVEKNTLRISRIVNAIQSQIDELTAKQSGSAKDPTNPGEPADDQELQKLTAARELAEQTRLNSQKLKSLIRPVEDKPMASIEWDAVSQQGLVVEKQLEELRRMFFSIVEHLRETAGRQDHLNGDTDKDLQFVERQQQKTETQDPKESSPQNADVKRSRSVAKKLAPLTSRQRELANVTQQIGIELTRMADQIASQIQPGTPQEKSNQEMLQSYSDAAKLVLEGQELMDEATAEMEVEDTNGETIRIRQQGSLEKLVEALRLLNPPDQQNQDKDEQQEQNQAEKRDNPNQSIFQQMRDKEAERRKNRNRGKYQERVEKDW